eukprot:TRINITY_DN33111_c0_g1_i1.p3 TRINITY_DN33111_c0_g1~~TRINITY_DN33111_c0_g1_i1.p3  ORF type:complete len:228 (+),score=106.80 TRINITY_DN33111_c0_g1_i1:64-747(+)
MPGDPYVEAKNEVEDMLFASDRLVQKIRRQHNEAEMRQLRELLVNIDETLEDVEEVVKAVGADPSRFNLTTAEYEKRRDFVRRARERLAGLQGQRDAFSASQQQQMRNFEDSIARSAGDRDRGEDTATEQLMVEQDLAMQRQNEEMQTLGVAIGRIKDMNEGINDELQQQEVVLEGMSKHMEQVTNKLKQTNKKIDKVIEKMSSTQQYICIAVLTIVLFVLMALNLT